MDGFQDMGEQKSVNAYLFAHTGTHEQAPEIGQYQLRENAAIAIKDYSFASSKPKKVINDDDQTMINFGEALYNSQYPNQIYFYAPSDNQKITIGIYFPNSTTTLTAIDNAQLKYLGEKDFILDEKFDGKDKYGKYDENNYNCNNRQDEIIRQTMILARSIKKDAWNTIVLPVDMNRRQVRDCFGMNVKLAIMNNELKNNGTIIDFGLVDMFTDQTSEDIIIHANTPYLIRIDEEKGRTSTGFSTYSGNIASGSQYFVVERMSCNLTTKRKPAYTLAKGTDENGNPVAITFMGVYTSHLGDNKIKLPCYALYDANDTDPNVFSVRSYPNGVQSYAFRALLFAGDISKTGISNSTTTAKANFITGVSFNGITDSSETTEILSVLNNNQLSTNKNIYDLSGRKVNIPNKKGIYIQNGRKVVIK